MAVIGFFGDSFFAYKIFNHPIAAAVFLLSVLTIIIAAMTQSLMESKSVVEKVAVIAVFGGNAIILLLTRIFGNEIWVFVFLIYEFILTIFIIMVYYIENEVDKKLIICVCLFFLSVGVNTLKFKYISEVLMVWAFIPAAILSAIAIFILFTFIRDWFFIVCHKKSDKIGVVVLTFFISYFFCWFALSTINTAFDGNPTINNYVIIDKHVSSGSTGISFEISIEIDGKKISIEVLSEVYYNLEKGDYLPVGYYRGALGFAYYKYEQNAVEQNAEGGIPCDNGALRSSRTTTYYE